MKTSNKWLITLILVVFAIIHYIDRSLLSPLIPAIMDELALNPEQVGFISTATLIVTTLGFLVWGIGYDTYSRVRLTALAGILWSLTTWLSTLSTQFIEFLITRASTGIDDAATPGIYTLLSDYFPPRRRSTIMGFMNVAPQAGFLIGGLLGTFVGAAWGWRLLFIVTGGFGFLIALIVGLVVQDVPRGSSEPEYAGLETMGTYRVNKDMIMSVLKRPSLLLLCLQGFFGVFPWNILSFWIFTYLETERFFSPDLIAMWLITSLLTMIIGNIIAGILGDALFRKSLKGRILLSAGSVLLSALCIAVLFTWPVADVTGFLVWSIITAFFMPMASPNVVATVFDITEPEIRSTSLSILRWSENIGSAFAPLTVGVLWYRVFGTLGTASWVLSAVTWGICGLIFLILLSRIETDIVHVRKVLSQRAQTDQQSDASLPEEQ